MDKGLPLLKEDVKNNLLPVSLLLFYYIFIKKFLRITCLMVALTGLPCPACGLTRAGSLLLQLKFEAAFKMHPFIYVIIPMIIAYALFRYLLGISIKPLNYISIFLLILLFIFYIYRMIHFFPGNPPISYYSNNLIHFIYEKSCEICKKMLL
ncbi:MAG: DUF2752 domain-containing protein [Lachnospiraceae bacterium]